MFAVSVSPATVSRVAPGLNSKSSSRCVPHARSTQSIARAGVTNKVSRMFGSIQTKSLLSSSTKRVSNVQSARHAVVPTASAPTGKGAKIIVQGIHLEVTDSIKEYCEQKMNKAVSHFDLHDVREVDVRCSARGGEKQVQCCVSQIPPPCFDDCPPVITHVTRSERLTLSFTYLSSAGTPRKPRFPCTPKTAS
jgi:hypothetical protein